MNNLTFYEIDENQSINLFHTIFFEKIGKKSIRFCLINNLDRVKFFETEYLRDFEFSYLITLFKVGS